MGYNTLGPLTHANGVSGASGQCSKEVRTSTVGSLDVSVHSAPLQVN